jgi:hypothetical protein
LIAFAYAPVREHVDISGLLNYTDAQKIHMNDVRDYSEDTVLPQFDPRDPNPEVLARSVE